MMTSKKYIYNIKENQNYSASKVIALIESGQEVLEIGCASGVQTRRLKEHLGCNVTGIELEPSSAEDARPYCDRLIIGNIEDLDLAQCFGKKQFDAIILADVLEHLYDPEGVILKVRPYLKREGYLVASIPNIAHAAICWELAHGRFDYNKYGLLDDTHIRFFTKKNLYRLFEKTGYRIVSLDRVTMSPEETEFNVHCLSPQEEAFLDWIIENNSEALTFQFIIKALPVAINPSIQNYETLNLLDNINKLEAKIGKLTRKIMELKSKILWMENHRFGIFSNLVNRIRSKYRNISEL